MSRGLMSTTYKQATGQERQHSLSGSWNKAKKSPAFWAAALPIVAATGGAALGTLGGAGTTAGAGAATQAGGWGGALKSVGSGLSKYGPLALGAWSAYEGHKGDQRAQELQDRALALAEQRDRELSPLRMAALQRIQGGIPRPDLSYLEDAGNPYVRRIPRVGSGA